MQSLALGAAAGYWKREVSRMVDSNAGTEPGVWGVSRDDGGRRAVEEVLRVAVSNFSNYTRAASCCWRGTWHPRPGAGHQLIGL